MGGTGSARDSRLRSDAASCSRASSSRKPVAPAAEGSTTKKTKESTMKAVRPKMQLPRRTINASMRGLFVPGAPDINTCIATTENEMEDSNEEPDESEKRSETFKKALVSFGACRLNSILKKHYVVVSFRTEKYHIGVNDKMNGFLAKFTPEDLAKRANCIRPYVAEGALWYGTSSMLKKGMQVRAFFRKFHSKVKATIEFVGTSGEDADRIFEELLFKVRAEKPNYYYQIENMCHKGTSESVAAATRFFTRAGQFTSDDSKIFHEQGLYAVKNSLKKKYVKDTVEISDYLNDYFDESYTVLELTGRVQDPEDDIPFGPEARALLGKILLKEKEREVAPTSTVILNAESCGPADLPLNGLMDEMNPAAPPKVGDGKPVTLNGNRNPTLATGQENPVVVTTETQKNREYVPMQVDVNADDELEDHGEILERKAGTNQPKKNVTDSAVTVTMDKFPYNEAKNSENSDADDVSMNSISEDSDIDIDVDVHAAGDQEIGSDDELPPETGSIRRRGSSVSGDSGLVDRNVAVVSNKARAVTEEMAELDHLLKDLNQSVRGHRSLKEVTNAESNAINAGEQSSGKKRSGSVLQDVDREATGTSRSDSEADTDQGSVQFDSQTKDKPIDLGIDVSCMELTELKELLKNWRAERDHMKDKVRVLSSIVEEKSRAAKPVKPGRNAEEKCRACIPFTFLEEHLPNGNKDKNYTRLTDESLIYVTKEEKKALMMAKDCTCPQDLYEKIMWSCLMTVENRSRCADAIKTGQGFKNVCQQYWDEIWDFVRMVAREKTKHDYDNRFTAWNLRFLTREKLQEIWRKEGLNFRNRLNSTKGILTRMKKRRQLN